MENEFVALAQNNESIQGQCWRLALCYVNSSEFWVVVVPGAGSTVCSGGGSCLLVLT